MSAATETQTTPQIHTTAATEDAGSSHKYTFNVAMSCGGCSGAVDRVLKKLDGVNSHEISLESQSVVVNAKEDLDYKTVLDTIKKTGKTVKEGTNNGVVMNV